MEINGDSIPRLRALKLRRLDTDDTDSTEECGSVAEVVRLRTSRDRFPISHVLGDTLFFLRGIRDFRVQTAQLQNLRVGLV